MNQFDAIIVGAGFHGLYQLHRLRQEGFSVRLVDAADGPGGVWRTNQYPGARVDSHVPNYEFSIEEVWRDWTWTERFPGWRELQRYFDHVDRVLDLSRDIDFNTRVTGAQFDASSDAWTIGTDSGEQVGARHLILCTGFASKPYIPELPGLQNFAGGCYHTATWPAGLESFDRYRVGVIGTGASGVQIVQEASKTADHLTVFQRSPVTALPMQQRSLDADQQRKDKARYPALFAQRNAPPGSFTDVIRQPIGAMEASQRHRQEVFQDAWDKGGFHFWAGTFNDITISEASNRAAYEFWRDNTRERIHDPAVAELLAPTEAPYPFGTKRPSLEQDYYEAFNQPNVSLVDLRSDPVSEITATGIRTLRADHPLDLLVLATGFDASTGGITQIDIRNEHDAALATQWSNGVDTYLGIGVPGFPNMHMLYGPQSPSAFCNGPTCAELQGEWLVQCLRELRTNGQTRIEAMPHAAENWSAQVHALATGTLFGRADSWYMGANIPGKRRQLLGYPATDAYLDALETCTAGGYSGFRLG